MIVYVEDMIVYLGPQVWNTKEWPLQLESDVDCSVHKFYTAANTTYSRSKYASELSKLF